MATERVSVDITSGTIFRIVLILLGFWFVYLIADIILMFFAAIVIAAAVEPIVNSLQRYRFPRALSVVLVYVVLIVLFVGLGTLFVQPLTEQLQQLAAALPHLVTRLSEFLPTFDQAQVTTTLQDALLRLGNNLTNISFNVFEQTRTFFSGIFTVLFVFVLAFYLVVERDALKKFARLITPPEHLPYIERALDRARVSIGRWVLAQLALGVIVGCIVGVGLWALGVRYALVLGLLAGVLEIIPVIGPIIAAIPGVIVALSQSITLGVLALIWYIVSQQLENHLLVPTIMRRAIGLNPLVTLLAILLGARLAGVGGVILSVPLATVISIFLSDLFDTSLPDDELAG